MALEELDSAIKSLGLELSKGTISLETFKQKIMSAFGSFGLLSSGASNASNAINGITGAAQKAGGAVENVSTYFSNMYDMAKQVTEQLGDTTDSIAGVAVEGLSLLTDIGKINSAFAEFNSNAGDANARMSEMANSKFMEKFGVFGEVLAKLQASKTAAVGFENALISAATSGGNLGAVFGQNAADFSGETDGILNSITQTASSSAQYLGMSLKESIDTTILSLKQLPGEFNKSYTEIVNGVNRPVSAMEMITLVSKGAGISVETGMTLAHNAIMKFGESGEQAAERISLLSKAQKETNIPMEKMQDYVATLDSSFASWGDQLGSAVKMLENVSSALKDSNLGFEGQIALVQQLHAGIAGMSFANRAFIGMQGGRTGGGALGSGLKVEQMLEDGKESEVADMIQDMVKNKTGASRIYTRKEALENPQMEGEFMRQRKLIQQFTGVTGDEEASRLMDAMSKGAIGGGGTEDMKGVLSESMSAGKNLQERQVSSLNDISVKLDTVAAIRDILLARDSDKLLKLTPEQQKERTQNNREEIVKRYAQPVFNTQKTKSASLRQDAGRAGEAVLGAVGSQVKNIANNGKKTLDEVIGKNIEHKLKELDNSGNNTKNNAKINELSGLLDKVKKHELTKEDYAGLTVEGLGNFSDTTKKKLKVKPGAEKNSSPKIKKQTTDTSQPSLYLPKSSKVENGNVSVNVKIDPLDIRIDSGDGNGFVTAVQLNAIVQQINSSFAKGGVPKINGLTS